MKAVYTWRWGIPAKGFQNAVQKSLIKVASGPQSQVMAMYSALQNNWFSEPRKGLIFGQNTFSNICFHLKMNKVEHLNAFKFPKRFYMNWSKLRKSIHLFDAAQLFDTSGIVKSIYPRSEIIIGHDHSNEYVGTLPKEVFYYVGTEYCVAFTCMAGPTICWVVEFTPSSKKCWWFWGHSFS